MRFIARLPNSLRALTIALVVSLALPMAGPALSQTTGGDAWAERTASELLEAGLDSRTPIEGEIAADQVPLFIPVEDKLVGRVSIPDQKLGVLVQPEGRFWRSFRIQGLFWASGALILLTIGVLAAFYLWRGTVRIESGRSGRWVERFGPIDRFAHWLTALAFITLALSGLVMIFGRTLLIPLIGHPAFSSLASTSKLLHNWSGIPFVIGLLLMVALWVKDNIPRRSDIEWLRQAGGMFNEPGTPHLETGRFNAGQKIIFWSVILGGLALSVTGYLLLAPFLFGGIGGMQTLHVVHALLAVVLIAVILMHIYIGTLGMEGAFDAMGRGEVDENWAAEHHRGWYEAEHRKHGGGGKKAGGIPAE